MTVKKSHLQIGLLLLGAAIVWSVSSYLRAPARPGSPPERGSEPLLGAEASPRHGQERGAIDPLSIPAPPAIDMSGTPSWGRDPFLFGYESRDTTVAGPVQVASADPIVRSILFSASRRVALIDNRLVGIGDQVGAFKVADIERTAVTFTLPTGERRRVGIYGPSSQGLKQ